MSNLTPGRVREWFAELEWAGEREFVALGTEEENEARLRAVELRSELAGEGWGRVRMSRPREVTVAIFWQSNPMACTYTTLLSLPAGSGGTEIGAERARGWRILIVEPDGPVRRALVRWLAASSQAAEVVGLSELGEAAAGRWHLVMCSQNHATGMVRSWVATAGPGGGASELLLHGVFRDSDAIFASVSGVTQGYFLRRVHPSDLLEPILRAFPEGPVRGGDTDRQVRRYFQSIFDPDNSLAAGRAGYLAALTARETDVLDLLRRGCVDKEIARELGISVWTVHSHLKRIFAKYGVRTRTEAVVRHLEK